MTSQQLFQEKLKLHKLSFSKSRQKIFQVLLSSESLTMADLINKTKLFVDKATVYRTISTFEKLKIIHKIPIGFKYKIELSDQYSYHHHHITCTICQKTFHINEDQRLEKILINQATELGWTLSSHQIELSGICDICRRKVNIS